MGKVEYALLFLGVMLLFLVLYRYFYNVCGAEGFATNPNAFKSESAYTSQVTAVTNKYGPTATSKRPVRDLLSQNVMPESQQNFVNFYALASRFTGYIGPMNNGYFDPDVAV
jgi:MFS-type transporter involved in bile tolerance (Atg22 family)